MINRELFFWKKVNKNGPLILDTNCWVWMAHLMNKGYGQFWDGEKILLAHRYSWNLHFGNLTKELLVCHKCDNPSCVNPDHLFLGTYMDNMKDMISKQRDYHNKKLTNEMVLQIYNDKRKTRDIAKEYNVHVGTIHEIKRGCTYKKVTGHQFKKIGKGRKLTDEQVLLIFNSSKTPRQLHEEFKITPEMVRTIKSGKCHAKITGCVSND